MIAQTKPISCEPFAREDCQDIGINIAPAPLSKRAKRKTKKAKQQAEADIVQLVEVRFDELNGFLCEGSITQDMLLQLRKKALEEHSDIDQQACDLLLF